MIGLANGGGDMTDAVEQLDGFGTAAGRTIGALPVGLQNARGPTFTESFLPGPHPRDPGLARASWSASTAARRAACRPRSTAPWRIA